jgi:hypothetical protein
VELVLRALFLVVIRPAGVLLRLRGDRLALRRPQSTNWRSLRG